MAAYDIIPDMSYYGSDCTYDYGCRYGTIGQGTFGTVFRAVTNRQDDIAAGSPLVVKVIHLRKGCKPLNTLEHWRKWENSTKKILELKHTNVVAFHKVTVTKSETGATVEVLMEHCRGGDLDAELKELANKKVLLDQGTAVRYSTEIAKGLSHLHDNYIIHGDLKPGNIFIKVTENGDRIPVIGDMDDIVQMRGNRTCTDDISNVRGTLRYMSPEMIRRNVGLQGKERIGRETDIWSLGCIILILAHHTIGREKICLQKENDMPVEADNMVPFEYSASIIGGSVPFVDPLVPREFRACIQRCLHLHSADRASADAVVKELYSILTLGTLVPANSLYSNSKETELSARSVISHLHSSEMQFGASIHTEFSASLENCDSTDRSHFAGQNYTWKGSFANVYAAKVTNHGITNVAAMVAIKARMLTTFFDLKLLKQPLQRWTVQFGLTHNRMAVLCRKVTIARSSGEASLVKAVGYYAGAGVASCRSTLTVTPVLRPEVLRYYEQIAAGLRFLYQHKDLPSGLLNDLAEQNENRLMLDSADSVVHTQPSSASSRNAIHRETSSFQGLVRYMPPEMPLTAAAYSSEETPEWTMAIHTSKMGNRVLAEIGDLDDSSPMHSAFLRLDVTDCHMSTEMYTEPCGDLSSRLRTPVRNPPLQGEEPSYFPIGRKTDVWSLGCTILELAAEGIRKERVGLQKESQKIDLVNDTLDSFFDTYAADPHVPVIMDLVSHFLRKCTRRSSSSSQRMLTTGCAQALKGASRFSSWRNVLPV